MPAEVDHFLRLRRTDSYDCLDFTREVWLAETGEDLGNRLRELLGGERSGRRIGRGARRFVKILSPISPCFVVMHALRTSPHIGVYLRGRVLHLRQRPEFFELVAARRGFSRTTFYL